MRKLLLSATLLAAVISSQMLGAEATVSNIPDAPAATAPQTANLYARVSGRLLAGCSFTTPPCSALVVALGNRCCHSRLTKPVALILFLPIAILLAHREAGETHHGYFFFCSSVLRYLAIGIT